MILTNLKKMSFMTLFLSFPVPFLSHANSDSIFPMRRFELNIAARPIVPYPALENYNSSLTSHGTGSNYTVEVSRHHIIPFNVLRDFYNTASRRGHLPALSGFFLRYSQNIVHYASSAGINCSRIGTDLIDAGNLAEAQSWGLARGGGNQMAPGFDTFEQFYAWLPGNLFIGPRNRSDDPESLFENNARVVVGEQNFERLSRAYRNMQNYINGIENNLNSIVADLTSISARRSVYNLNPNNWEYVHGKYRLKNIKNLHEIFESEEVITFSDDTYVLYSPTLTAKFIAIQIAK